MFTIYSKPNCPYCDQAKALLENKGLSFKVINIDVGQNKEAGETYISREAFLTKIPGARTVPQIFKETDTSAVHIGGFTELRSHLHA